MSVAKTVSYDRNVNGDIKTLREDIEVVKIKNEK